MLAASAACSVAAAPDADARDRRGAPIPPASSHLLRHLTTTHHNPTMDGQPSFQFGILAVIVILLLVVMLVWW